MEWLRKQWTDHPQAVYLGALLLLTVLAWIISVGLVGSPSNSLEGDVKQEQTFSAPRKGWDNDVRYAVASDDYYGVQVTVTPTDANKAVISAKRSGMGIITTLSPETAKAEVSFMLSKNYFIRTKPAVGQMSTNISDYAPKTCVTVTGVRDDGVRVSLGEQSWNRISPEYQELAVTTQGFTRVDMTVTIGQGDGVWLPLEVEIKEANVHAAHSK
ncbi:hypothetical protein [Syntrophothermus lipocalidus]|uniref:Uncharacterized protein n=1 Tax=Syntrophothermus lipocalidus (strain DSM 12680 / TGB-C1) TaxID=643648 RepID=D7CPZ1_SYNLT|nr:hypothetical protein [Syntrophothermus lipocalidus]ADI02769.1 hypothetical protein Slip_2022 [Syntrophothermus lipocalidus DSM 12680]